MADLTSLQAAQSVKIAGADSSGVESNFVDANANGKIYSADISNNGGVHGAITVGTSAIEAKVGGSALSNRVSLTLHNTSNSTMYWGYSNTVTTSTGTPIYKDQFVSWAVGPSTTVYVIAGSAGNDARVTESA